MDKGSSNKTIHLFAVEKLKPNYMFWLRRTKELNNGTNYWQDVLNYFQSFNWESNPTGSLSGVCPSKFVSCNTN